MKSDRELLEWAAKAYGLNGEYYKKQRMVREFVFVIDEGMIASGRTAISLWNPLTNDGDAFRLAVKLKIEIERSQYSDNSVYAGPPCTAKWREEPDGEYDIFAASRRAVVCAAAIIGEEMK